MPGRQLTPAQRKRNREAADWLLRNRESGQPETEKAAFQRWLDRDAENCRAYETAQRLLGDARNAIQSEPSLRDLEIRPVRSAIVPSLAVVVALGAVFYGADGPMRLRADVMSGAGEMPLVTLEDGSTMQLNASSAVAFDFSQGRRAVRLLRGQAFFDVAPDASRPFSVETGRSRVTALGTAFDVRAGETETDVTVTHHAVLVEFTDGRQAPVRLEEGEQISYAEEAGVSDVRKADNVATLAWRRGQLSLDNAPLSYVVEELGRHFSGRIVIGSSSLLQRRVSGTLSVTDTDAALHFLRTALKVRTHRIGPLVLIRD